MSVIIFETTNQKLISDIAPLVSIPDGISAPDPWSSATVHTYYKSVVYISESQIGILAIFDSYPTIDSSQWQGSYFAIRESGSYYYISAFVGGPSTYSGEWIDGVVRHFNNIADAQAYGTEPPYNWKSVKTIKGKEGSFRLSDILNINEAQPVTDVPAAGNVNFTKKTKLDTLINRALETDGNPTKATVSFTLPNATYSFAKLVYKLGQMPEDEDDGVAIDITPDDSVAKIEDLEQDKSYWFAIFTNKTESNAVEYRTGEVSDEYYEFDYTGSIQTFTAPKTGYYQIETWGAQGGNATDGTNTARGGYGAYAVGEVLLQQGETIYINVGGQNGYGGGGNYTPPNNE